MRILLSRLFFVFFAGAGALSLLACTPGGSGTGLALITPAPTIERFENDEGDVELLMEPIDVWDGKNAQELEEITIDEKTYHFRLREKEVFEHPWVRLGLFWNSRVKYAVMPVVVAGPPVEIKKVQVKTANGVDSLELARNFNFEPGKRPFDKPLSFAVFTLPAEMLGDIANTPETEVSILTSRGVLRVNLSAVTSSDQGTLKASAKYQFAEFYRQQQAVN